MITAEAAAHPFDLVVASFGRGLVALRRGEVDEGIMVLERALELCQVGHVPFWFPLIGVWLGSAYASAGRLADALPLVQHAVDQHAAIGLVGVHSLFVTLQGETVLKAGRLDEAAALGERALGLAQNSRERGHRAWALGLVGDVESHREPIDIARTEGAYRDAIELASELGMRPLIARCHLALGRLYGRVSRGEAAATLATARALFAEMGMEAWFEDGLRDPPAKGRLEPEAGADERP